MFIFLTQKIYFMDCKLTEQEFNDRITEIAKNAIKQYCINDDNTVEYVSYASIEITSDSDFAKNYPHSIEEYCNGNFRVDDIDILSGKNPKEVIEFSRFRLFEGTVDKRIKELLDGGWDAIKTVEETKTVTESKTVFEE